MQTGLGRRSEKRGVTRGRVTLPATYTSDNVVLEGTVTDVSPEGMFFCSDFLDAHGEIASLRVQLPNRREPLQLRAEVCRISDAPHGGGMGLRLVGASLNDRLALSAAADPVDERPAVTFIGNA